MSRYCPSCGSTVETGDTVCPTCGEALDAVAAEASTDISPVAAAIPAPAPSVPVQEAPAPRRGVQKITCPDCGAGNDPGATECSVCGGDLTARPAPAATVKKNSTPARSSPARDYLFASVAAIVVAGIAMLVSIPEEKTGPPVKEQPQQAAPGGEMPAGHPPVDEKKLTPEQERQIAGLQSRVKADPSDTASVRGLADVYYDLDRHGEALALYRKYLEVAPRNLSVRTDMAFSLATSVNLDSGITELHSVLKENPKFQNAAYNLAMMHLAKRNRDSTLFWLRRVVELDSTSRPGQFAGEILRDISKIGLEEGDTSHMGSHPPGR